MVQKKVGLRKGDLRDLIGQSFKEKNKAMKTYFSLLAAVVLLAGCANRYDITTTNGMTLKGVSKPVLHKDTDEYFFTDAQRKQMAIKAVRVRDIAVQEKSSKFTNKSDSGFKATFSR